MTLVVGDGGSDTESSGPRYMDLSNGFIRVLVTMYVMECAVEDGIIFFVVMNDLLNGVTSDERAAVVGINGGTRVDDVASDW